MRLQPTSSVRERAQALLDAIAVRDGALRCYVEIDGNAVLREAERLDAVPPERRGALHGEALAVKDLIDVAGLPTRAGSSFFRRDPREDAPVVARLRAAGALVIGKTNTHEFAWGITTDNPHFGRTANPHDPARTAGGSSGGSGAAIAAGLADIALGTDTLGSVRTPAALCGVCGIRPATGMLPSDGIVPLAPGLDAPGPLARDVAGVRRAYEALTGAALRPAAAPRRVARVRGGRWETVAPAVRDALDALASRLAAHGTIVEDVTWWDDELIEAVTTVQMRAAARVHAPLIAVNRERYGEDVRGRIERALTVTDADARAAQKIIQNARASWRSALAGFPCVLAPAAGDEAPLAPVPESFRGEIIPLVTPASAFALPALAVPCGTGTYGMPLGVQVIGADPDPAPVFALGDLIAR